KEIETFIADAVFPAEEKAEESDDIPNLSFHLLKEVIGSIDELKVLQKSKEEQAGELMAVKATREIEQKQQKKLENKLKKLNENWKEFAIPEEPISILENLQQTANKEARAAEKEEREQGTAVTVAET